MKTSWSLDYLNSKLGPREVHEWGLAKARQLEKRTGVKWSRNSEHGRLVFLPVMWKGTEADRDCARQQRLLSAYRVALCQQRGWRYVSFLCLHKESGLSLPEVMAVVKGLVLEERVDLTVNRMGYAAAMALKY